MPRLLKTVPHRQRGANSIHIQSVRKADAYPSPGPIFIHAKACEEFGDDRSFPEELRSLPLMPEAYGEDRWVIACERLSGNGIEEAIERLFSTEEVRYIHVRNTEAGCFIAHIERTH